MFLPETPPKIEFLCESEKAPRAKTECITNT